MSTGGGNPVAGGSGSGGGSSSLPIGGNTTHLWPNILDYMLVPLGVFLLAGYYLSLLLQLRRNPLSTVIGLARYNRFAWVHFIMHSQDRTLLGVQTLRNSMMAAQIMGTTTIALSTGIAALLSSSTSLSNNVPGFYLGARGGAVVAVKFFLLLLCFLGAFMCFIQSIRYNNHVSFLIALPKVIRVRLPAPDESSPHTPDFVATLLQRGDDLYTVGIRLVYSAFPILVWLFGPIPMFATCVAMVPILYSLDTASFKKRKMTKESSMVKDLEAALWEHDKGRDTHTQAHNKEEYLDVVP